MFELCESVCLTTTVLVLTYNYGVTDFAKGNANAQIAICTDVVYNSAEGSALQGRVISRWMGLFGSSYVYCMSAVFITSVAL